MRWFLLIWSVLVVGCAVGSFFASEMTWYKEGATEEEMSYDLEEAQREYEKAHDEAMQNREFSYDPSGTGDPRFGGGYSTEPGADSTVMVDKDVLVDRFMQARGWVRVTIDEARRRRDADESRAELEAQGRDG